LHPVAGQGLNLGLRDAARLAQTLAGWLASRAANAGSNPGPALAEFASARHLDRFITAGLTDFMPRLRHRACARRTRLRRRTIGDGPCLPAARPARATPAAGIPRLTFPRSGPGQGLDRRLLFPVCYQALAPQKWGFDRAG